MTEQYDNTLQTPKHAAADAWIAPAGTSQAEASKAQAGESKARAETACEDAPTSSLAPAGTSQAEANKVQKRTPSSNTRRFRTIAVAAVVVVLAVVALCTIGVIQGTGKKAVVLVDQLQVTNGSFEEGTVLYVQEFNSRYWKTTYNGQEVYVQKSRVMTDSQVEAAAAAARRRSSSGGTTRKSPPLSEIEQMDTQGLDVSALSQDGGEITLSAYRDGAWGLSAQTNTAHGKATFKLLDLFAPDVAYADDQPGENATVIEGGAFVVVGFLARGTEITVVDMPADGLWKVKANDIEGYVSGAYVRLVDSDAATPEPRDFYVIERAEMFADYLLEESVQKMFINDTVRVVDVVNGVALIETPEGTMCYMLAAQLGDTPVDVSYYSPSRQSSSDNAGSSSSAGPSQSSGGDDSNDESNWSPPVL